jgi:hypothetical protein
MSKPFLAFFATFVFTAPLAAQSKSVISSADLDSAVTATQTDARAAVVRFIESKEVRAAAALLGVTPEVLAAKVARLDSAEANRLAAQVSQVDGTLAGGLDLRIGIGAILLIILLIWIFSD